MKIEVVDNKIIVYLFNENINVNDILELNNKIKDIFLRIMKKSNYDFFGYNKVDVYYNENYGTVLEVERIGNNEFNYQRIDLKIVVYKNAVMFFEFDDYYFDKKPKSLVLKDGKYYLKIDNKLNVWKYIEFAKIKYKKMINEID